MAYGHSIKVPPIEIDISRELVPPKVHSILSNFKFYLFITLFIYTLSIVVIWNVSLVFIYQ